MLTHTSHSSRRAGDLDRSFGNNGTTILEGDDVKAIAVLKTAGAHQGKIIGVLRDGADFKLFRLEKNGLLDTSFGTHGYLRWGFANSPVTSIPTGITELSGDKLIVTGYVQEGSPFTQNYPAVARFNSSGSIDPNFGQNGVFVFKEQLPTAQHSADATTLETNAIANVSVVNARDGRILLSFNSSGLRPYLNQGLLIQLTSSGHLDERFNKQGYVFFQFGRQNTSSVGLVTRKSGNIIVAGYTTDHGFLAEFTEIGQIDPSFGTNGFTALGSAAGALRLSSLLLQSDDKPVAIGSFLAGAYVKGYVTRTLPDGKPDHNFNQGQALVVERQFQSLQLNSAELDSEQAIVVAGELNTRALCLVGRVTPQGTMDASFGIDGLSDTTTEGILNFTNSVAIQDATQIVIAGKTSISAVSRYLG